MGAVRASNVIRRRRNEQREVTVMARNLRAFAAASVLLATISGAAPVLAKSRAAY